MIDTSILAESPWWVGWLLIPLMLAYAGISAGIICYWIVRRKVFAVAFGGVVVLLICGVVSFLTWLATGVLIIVFLGTLVPLVYIDSKEEGFW